MKSTFFNYIFLGLLSINNHPEICSFGTLIAVIPFENGIVLAADSRISLKTEFKGEIINLGYYDEVEKLFRLKQFVLAVSGKNEFNGILINKIIDDFNSSDSVKNSPSELLLSFHNYLIHNYGDFYNFDVLENKFFCCGFVNGVGEIAYLENGKITIEQWSLIISEKVSVSFQEKIKEISVNVKNQTDLIKFLENIIYLYANETDQTYKIGGPISILKISDQNEISWLQNDFSDSSYN